MNDARRLQRLLASKGRPMWQRRILRIVSPAWRAKERRVAETCRLIDLAWQAHTALERTQSETAGGDR